MRYSIPTVFALMMCLGGCTVLAPQTAPTGARASMRLQLPPDKAAACFARNAEDHSSALVAEVRTGRDSAQVIVRVRNGVLYGTGDFERAGSGSTATLTLNVTSNGPRSDLVEALLDGC